MESIPISWLPLVGLLVVPAVVIFVVWLEPVAVLALVNTVIIVVAVRIMFGSADEKRFPSRLV
jgi:hypothetical protein